MPAVIPLSIVCGADYAQREAHIAQLLQQTHYDGACAVILEGLPGGAVSLNPGADLLLQRIAPACFCCIGALPFRVTLNRMIRQRPRHIYLSLAGSEHLKQLQEMFAAPPFNVLLLAQPPICL